MLFHKGPYRGAVLKAELVFLLENPIIVSAERRVRERNGGGRG